MTKQQVTLRFAGLIVIAALGLGSAQAASEQKPSGPAAAEKKVVSGEDGSRTIRERDEARQRDWDRKMKALTSSICTGC